jgi:hypothetical protein
MSSIVPQAVEQPAKADGAREVRGGLEVTRAPELSRVVRLAGHLSEILDKVTLNCCIRSKSC